MENKIAIYTLKNKKAFIEFKLDNHTTEEEILDNIANCIFEAPCVIGINNINFTDSDFYQIAKKIKTLCAEFNSTLIIYSRCDIAFLIDADGVLLLEKDLNIEDVKKILHDNCLIGKYIANKEEELNFDNNKFDFILTNKNTENINNQIVFIQNLKTKQENRNINFFMIKS